MVPWRTGTRVREPSGRRPDQREEQLEAELDYVEDVKLLWEQRTPQPSIKLEITFCNRAYSSNCYKVTRRQIPRHFAILQSIIDEIEITSGGEISKSEIFSHRPKVEAEVKILDFDLMPSRCQMLRHNGNGIRHAKFAPSKSIAIIWDRICDNIYVTFDDHAPVRYHRAIAHLRDLRMCKRPFLKRPRNTGRFLHNLKRYWKQRYIKEMYGFSPRTRYYE